MFFGRHGLWRAGSTPPTPRPCGVSSVCLEVKPVGEPDAVIRTSGSMSGERNRGGALRPYSRLSSTLPMKLQGTPATLVRNGPDCYFAFCSEASLKVSLVAMATGHRKLRVGLVGSHKASFFTPVSG